MATFQTTWVWVRDTTDCPACNQPAGKPCRTKSGRPTQQLHQARKIAHIQARQRRLDDAQRLTLDLMHFKQVHRYDAFANPDKVGLGQCRCGVDMYYSEHDRHFAEKLQEQFVVTPAD